MSSGNLLGDLDSAARPTAAKPTVKPTAMAGINQALRPLHTTLKAPMLPLLLRSPDVSIANVAILQLAYPKNSIASDSHESSTPFEVVSGCAHEFIASMPRPQRMKVDQ
jgi:hypothetical protein